MVCEKIFLLKGVKEIQSDTIFLMGRSYTQLPIGFFKYSMMKGIGTAHDHHHLDSLRDPLIINNLSLPPRIKYGVNFGGSNVMSRASGFLLSQE